jgi:hypothetical protein
MIIKCIKLYDDKFIKLYDDKFIKLYDNKIIKLCDDINSNRINMSIMCFAAAYFFYV